MSCGYMSPMPDRDLPEDLVLPLASGEPWWYWCGGRPAVDLVNTHRERWRRGVETLVTPGDLTTWLVRAGVMDHPEPVTRDVLTQARELREAINGLLVAAIDHAPAPVDALALVDERLPLPRARAGRRVERLRRRAPPARAGPTRRARPRRARRSRLAAPRAGHDRPGRRA